MCSLTCMMTCPVSTKIEKEKKEHARQHGMIRTEISGAEIAEEMEKERRFFQLQMCEVGLVKTKCRFWQQAVAQLWRFPQIKDDGFYFEKPVAWPSSRLTQTDKCVRSISSKSTRSRSRKGWTCCRTSSSTSTRSASKTRCFL